MLIAWYRTNRDYHHNAFLNRLQSIITAYPADQPIAQKSLALKIEEKFGSGAKAFAFFDGDKVGGRQDGVVHFGEFYNAAMTLGCGRRQEDVLSVFQTLDSTGTGKICFTDFMKMFGRNFDSSLDGVQSSPKGQMGLFIQYSKAPSPKVTIIQLGEFIELSRKQKRKDALPSDADPRHMYGRVQKQTDRIEDLLSHSFVFSRKSSGGVKSKSPIPVQPFRKPRFLPELKIRAFR